MQGNAEAVAAQIAKIHGEEASPLFDNKEQLLRGVAKLAYFSYRDHYLKFEELPSGNGYVDIVYLPKKHSLLQALVIEMKRNRSAEGTIGQIKAKQYPAALDGYGGEIVLAGIHYDAKTKEHSCVIERQRLQFG